MTFWVTARRDQLAKTLPVGASAIPSDALMVGDSVSDVTAARAAGFGIVCVSYGYNHGVDIRTANPDAVMDSLTEIQGLLEQAA